MAVAQTFDYSTSTLRAYALMDARDYRINAAQFLGTLKCESHFQWDAVSKTDDYGVAQINAKAHPDITRAQALNPYWSIDWAAQAFANGQQRMWVCWRIKYGQLRE